MFVAEKMLLLVVISLTVDPDVHSGDVTETYQAILP